MFCVNVLFISFFWIEPTLLYGGQALVQQYGWCAVTWRSQVQLLETFFPRAGERPHASTLRFLGKDFIFTLSRLHLLGASYNWPTYALIYDFKQNLEQGSLKNKNCSVVVTLKFALSLP